MDNPPVNMIDQLEELGIQIHIIGESFLDVLHHLNQQDGLFPERWQLVYVLGCRLGLHPILHHLGDGLQHLNISRLLDQSDEDGSDECLAHFLCHDTNTTLHQVQTQYQQLARNCMTITITIR